MPGFHDLDRNHLRGGRVPGSNIPMDDFSMYVTTGDLQYKRSYERSQAVVGFWMGGSIGALVAAVGYFFRGGVALKRAAQNAGLVGVACGGVGATARAYMYELPPPEVPLRLGAIAQRGRGHTSD